MQNKRSKKGKKSAKNLKNKILVIVKYIFVYIPLSFLAVSLLSVLLLKWVPVYCTPLMIIRSVEHISDNTFKSYKTWKPLEKISPNMQMAVIASEDTRFLEHMGFDWVEIDNALDAGKKGRRIRGASTISQQTAKNVFLFPSRSWVRKGFEAYFTLGIELIWGKRRILEVYLNVAEMGRGIYGTEAAANQLFQKSAQKLTSRESSLIAATLPNPLKRRANSPSAYINSRASDIQALMGMIEVPEWLKNSKKKKNE
ncbi:MAG: monofunctional biosynthetic peptidoglycan transglycosylase [Bacteroidetes bacterium GWF2_40_14]|nr:MAG: monofunctional biosynthetic peptidoglycan transglycosylase [Bacteroidetes bacterium GWF2_40_14]